MSSISLLAQIIVHSFYRPLVLVLLLVLTTACVPQPDLPQPRRTSSLPPNPRPAVPRPAPRPTPALPQGPSQAQLRPPPALVESIKSLGRNFNGKVGIAVTRIDGQWVVDHQGSQLFPQHSVSKTWVALTLADLIDRGSARMDEPITVTKNDLTLFHQPIRALVDDDGYETTVSDLFYRAMTESDNTANDRLLRRVGGPEAVRNFIASKGLGNIRFGPGERLFQSAIAGMTWRQSYSIGNAFFEARRKVSDQTRGTALKRYLEDPTDGAAPIAVVQALSKLQLGVLLSPNMTRLFLSTMQEAQTGKKRIRGGVPPGWGYGHKTGTGQSFDGLDTGYNDVGIMTAPDGTAYAVAVMISHTRATVEERQNMMQAVAATIASNHRR